MRDKIISFFVRLNLVSKIQLVSQINVASHKYLFLNVFSVPIYQPFSNVLSFLFIYLFIFPPRPPHHFSTYKEPHVTPKSTNKDTARIDKNKSFY